MSSEKLRGRANAVRSIPLVDVLIQWGADRDRCDRHRWHTERGPISVTGSKFFSWHEQQGSGGAIDLVMHLGQWDVVSAIEWLEQRFGQESFPFSPNRASRSFGRNVRYDSVAARPVLRLPQPDRDYLHRVRRYLTQRRRLSPDIVESLITSNKMYADRHGNAVFLMVAGKTQRPVGAELRGTRQRVWHGLAPGTRKDAGFFWVGAVDSRNTSVSNRIVLCESAIDAISCCQLQATNHNGQCLCISTAGVRSNTPWLASLLVRGYEIYCGFDNDEPGNAAARRMIQRHPSIRRLQPPAHDWNDAILAGKS